MKRANLFIISTVHDEYNSFDIGSLHIPLLDKRNAVREDGCRVYRA